MQKYLVTDRPHYIGDRLVYPGRGADSVVTLPEGVEPGAWLVAIDDNAPELLVEPVQSVKSQGIETQGVERYTARHTSNGTYIVEDSDTGARVAEFKKADGDAKEKATAEANRLNAGGDPQAGEPVEVGAGQDLPDA